MNPETPQNNSSTSVNVDNKTMAIIAHIGGLLTSFIVPLVIWLMQKDKDAASAAHALEALNFQIALLIGGFVATILTVIIIGALAFPVLFILDIVFSIQGAIAASNNQPYRYPVSLRLIK